jgi:hypothetical protein
MNEISYTSKAKDDLARIEWKIRERIITIIAGVQARDPFSLGFRKLLNSDLIKLIYDEHVIIGKIEKDTELNILTIQKRQKLHLPEEF